MMASTNFDIFRLNINIFSLCSLSKFSKKNNSLIKFDYNPLFVLFRAFKFIHLCGCTKKKFVKFEMQKCRHDDN